MNTNKTPYEFIAPLVSEILQPILPLEYANATSYMEQLNMVCKKVVELVDAENKNPETIYNLVKQMYTEGSLQGIVADIISDICVNVKYPPAGLTPAKGDGKTNDWAAIVNILNYCKSSQNNILLYFPAGNYYATTETIDTMTFGGMIYGKTLTVCGCGRSSRLSIGKNKVRILCDLHNLAISADGNITVYGNALSVDYTTGNNTDVQGQGNNLYINMEKTGYDGDELTFTNVANDSPSVYNIVNIMIHGHDVPKELINYGNNTVKILGYQEYKRLTDLNLSVSQEADISFPGGLNLTVGSKLANWLNFKGRLYVEDTGVGVSSDYASNGFYSSENPILLETGDLDDIPNAGARVRVQKDTIELAAKRIQFGDKDFDPQITETPAQAFKLYPATDEQGNKTAVVLENENTKNISVCYYNNVWFEKDFSVPIPAGYLTSDDVISIEVSGFCQDSNNPATMTLGGQTVEIGTGKFYAKFIYTALVGGTDNIKISGFCVDSTSGTQVLNTSVAVNPTQPISIAFGSGNTTIYWSVTAHYN